MKKLFFILPFLIGCVSRQEIEAELFQFDRIPQELCVGPVAELGIYRVVKCKNNPQNVNCQHGEIDYEEVIPYCSRRIEDNLAANRDKVIGWLNQISRPRK